MTRLSRCSLEGRKGYVLTAIPNPNRRSNDNDLGVTLIDAAIDVPLLDNGNHE